MQQMPRISVIIPAFRPRDFTALMLSMADNTNSETEWIVVDDGSGSKFDAVFDTLPSDVIVLRQTDNRRQGAARNVGLTVARGQWIKFLDADDRLDAGHLSALLAQAVAPNLIPFAPTRHMFASGVSWVNDSWGDLPEESQVQLARLLHQPFLHHCGALFPRSLLNELGGYDESLITDEDGDLLIRVLMEGWSFVAVPEVQYLYMHHNGERVSSDNEPRKLAARLRVCEKVEAVYAARRQKMPGTIRNGLAKRLDKVALSYWNENRATACNTLERAQALSPNYIPDMRLSLRILRKLGGLSAVLAATALYRRLRGRPSGGSQG